MLSFIINYTASTATLLSTSSRDSGRLRILDLARITSTSLDSPDDPVRLNIAFGYTTEYDVFAVEP